MMLKVTSASLKTVPLGTTIHCLIGECAMKALLMFSCVLNFNVRPVESGVKISYI
uniref:Uncharacterized protein n=1 Tax=Physcomitrium patens TaxID=3218 RepID=A0A2K1J3K6_PHYPA|nr:hypothetical protein PHYPA_021952 [Physcomitrium patens]